MDIAESADNDMGEVWNCFEPEAGHGPGRGRRKLSSRKSNEGRWIGGIVMCLVNVQQLQFCGLVVAVVLDKKPTCAE